MVQTTRLQLPLLAASQAQKHVTHNEALLKLDGLAQLTALSATLAVQPASAGDGDIYLLPPGKTGVDWGGAGDHAVAHHFDGVWHFYTPRHGWIAYVQDIDALKVFDGAVWNYYTTGQPLNDQALVLDTQGNSTIGVTAPDVANLVVDGTEAMRWSPTGNTQPTQPAFLASITEQASNVTGASLSYVAVIYDTEILDRSNSYDPATGVFTAPIGGIYAFQAFASVDFNTVPNVNEFVLQLTTSNRSWYSTILNPQGIANPAKQTNTSASYITDMDAGDTAQVKLRLTGGSSNAAHIRSNGYFSGCLLA